MTLAKKIALNTIVQAGSKIISTVLGLLTIALITRYLGPAGFGEYTTIITFISFFAVIADLGLTLVTVQLICQPNIEKNKILDLLRIQKETIIVDEKVQEVLKLSQLQYDENGLNLYYVMTKSTPNDEINKAIYENSPFDLASYKFNGELKKLNSHEFQKFRDNSILKSKIDNTSAIKKNIRDFIIEKFVSNEAKEIGLDKTIKFILEQKSYRYGLIKSLYETKEIIYSKELTEEELTNFYAQNINNYVGPKEVIISLFYFDEFEKAQLARSEIIMASRTGRNVQFGDKDFLPGLKKYIYKDTIDRISKNLNSEFIEQVFKMQKNIVSRPILVNGEYVLVLKLDEIGAQYKPFKAVSDEIRRSIIEKKRIESKNIRIKELKNKFDIEINLLDEIY